jgi:hypothetical protein
MYRQGIDLQLYFSSQSQNNCIENVYSFTKTVGNPVSCMNNRCEVQSVAQANMSPG